IEQLRLRTVTRAEPVGRTLDVREDERALETGRDPFLANRPSLRIESVCPCLLRVRRTGHKLPGGAIEDVVEPVAILLRQELSLASSDLRLEQHHRLVRVPVVYVFGRELEMPLNLPVGRIDCQDSVGVKVVARTIVGVPV